MDRQVLCPKCGVEMIYQIEKEKSSSGEIRITRYYKCPVCGTKIIDERLVLRPIDGKILVFSLINGKKPIIPGRQVYTRRPRPLKNSRPVQVRAARPVKGRPKQ